MKIMTSMSRMILSFVALLWLAASAFAAPQTMRLDYFHTGDAKSETFSFDRVSIEPLPWPGDMRKDDRSDELRQILF